MNGHEFALKRRTSHHGEYWDLSAAVKTSVGGFVADSG